MRMYVKIDVSEHVRYIDKITILAVATDDGTYKKNVCLYPRVKRRILRYAGKVDQIHACLAFLLLKEDLLKYSEIQFCTDVSKNKLTNNLRKLFKQHSTWKMLEQNHGVHIRAVKNSFVDYYAKSVRKGSAEIGRVIEREVLLELLKILEN